MVARVELSFQISPELRTARKDRLIHFIGYKRVLSSSYAFALETYDLHDEEIHEAQ